MTVVSSQKGLSSYEKMYDAILSKLYQIKGEQMFNIPEKLKELKFKKKKKNILIQFYLIFTSSTIYLITNMPIINERVSISVLVSAETNN